MNTNVLRAVFTRNFVAYFANPTGYVFICVFVLLSSLAAFWPYEFFNANLANLDQLNRLFPLIMLIFIPAITMSVWAEERRQATDELLLTTPANDFDIVLGKYLAAVAIYGVSLLFSAVCNFIVLGWLSEWRLDLGLLVGNYVGYLMVGLAMLAVGMAASFLTVNLTVAFVLGTLLNAPLVAAAWAEAILPATWARNVKAWSVGEQLADFGRGVIGISGVAYFGMILVVMLYLSMVLIGRRHWARGRDWHVMALHYLARTAALAVLAFCVAAFFYRFPWRYDATTEKLGSLSPSTRKLLRDLELERPVQIEAFISPVVPTKYVQTQRDLRAMLEELHKYGRDQVQVRVHDTERFTDVADRAKERFGIEPRTVPFRRRGAWSDESIFMGLAFTSGLEEVVLPFVGRGIPVEYELVRSICTVSQQERQKIGILRTDAQLYGRFSMQTMSPGQNWPIIDELEKMYEVEEVDPSSEITEQYDALLAVQPSSLGEEEMRNFVAAVRRGTPTAVFEDPFPAFAGGVPGTSEPRRPPGGMNPWMMRQPPMPKGNINELWRMLGVDFVADQIIWQDSNPHPNLSQLPSEVVFITKSSKIKDPFNESQPVTSKLQELVFPFPGSIRPLHAAQMDFEPLVRTGQSTGTVGYHDMFRMGPFGRGPLDENRPRKPTNTSYVLAAHITGTIKSEEPPPETDAPEEGDDPTSENTDSSEDSTGATGESGDPGDAGADSTSDDAGEDSEKKATDKKPKQTRLNVVLVADIDMLHRQFFEIREMGLDPEMGLDFRFDNVTFVLNVLDVLAGDKRFVEIRKRRPEHRTLSRLDEVAEEARTNITKARDELQEKFDKARDEEQQALNKDIDKLREDMRNRQLDADEIARRVAMVMNVRQQRMQTKVDRLEQQMKQDIEKIEKEEALGIRRMQDRYKMWAVLLPPIPPLIVAIVVFFTRRARERATAARSRLR